jgi:hypothetical protein
VRYFCTFTAEDLMEQTLFHLKYPISWNYGRMYDTCSRCRVHCIPMTAGDSIATAAREPLLKACCISC